jgi:Fe-S-cluster containining protein
MSSPRTHYDCSKCPAYCCSIYARVEVNERDLDRLARYFGTTRTEAERHYTKRVDGTRVLRRKKDALLGEVCRFLDPTTRGCTIYEGRPKVCREYPGKPRCAYYDVLQFERETQEDPDVLPLFQITFKPRP